MLQIKNTLGGGKPEGLYAWKKNEIGSELKKINKSVSILPYDFYYGSAVVLNGEIHILGGSSSKKSHYKWNGSSWVNVSTLPYKFYQGSAVVLDGEIHILGGYDIGVGLKHYKWNGSLWTSASTLPYDFYDGSAVVLNREIHILGGNSGSNQTKHYKFDGTSWTSASTLPYDFYQGSAVVFENKIHILGSATTSAYYKYHYIFNGASWTSFSALPYNFYSSVSVIYNNAIHILGSGDSGYYTAHFSVSRYVPVYTFIDYVVSDKETAYPDGGVQNGYYYEKVGGGITPEMFGCTKMAVDTFTLASDTKGMDKYINHSLEEIPKFISVSCNESSLGELGIYGVLALNMTKKSTLKYGTCFFNNSGETYESSSSLQSISSSVFRVYGNHLWKANVKYTVITMA